MCKFTRTLHICGHSNYILETSCSYYFISPITSTPSCSLLRHPTRALPNKFITQTINSPTQTCGQDTCLYKPENDPFITILDPNPPPKTPKPKGRSLFDELQPYNTELFSDAVKADAYSRSNFMIPKLGPIVIGRGCVRISPKVVYHKYTRLSTTPSERLVRESPPPKAVDPEEFYGTEVVRKRKIGELVSGIEALEVYEALEKRRRSAQLTPMDMST